MIDDVRFHIAKALNLLLAARVNLPKDIAAAGTQIDAAADELRSASAIVNAVPGDTPPDHG